VLEVPGMVVLQTPQLVPVRWACVPMSTGTRGKAARLARALLGLVLGGKS